MRYLQPANARRIDRELSRLGVKDRVIEVLIKGWNVVTIRDVICWVQLDGPELKPVVVAQFERVEGGATSRKKTRNLGEAMFDASGEGPFGPVSSEPLNRQQVSGIQRLVAAAKS